MWTGIDWVGGPTAVSTEDSIWFWVSSAELAEDIDLGSRLAVGTGAGDSKVMASLSSKGCQTSAPSLGMALKSSSVSLPPWLVRAAMMAWAQNLPICGRLLSSASSALLILTGFGTCEAIVD